MADWSKPTLSSLYTDFLTEVKNRDDDIAKQFDGTTSTNLVTGYIRWNSSINRWQKWNGSAWAELATTYALTGLSTTGAAAIGGDLSYTGTFTGGTGVVNLGSGQFYKDGSGNIGVGTTSPSKSGHKALTINGTLPILEFAVADTLTGYIFSNASQMTLDNGGAKPITFLTNSTERLRIDSSGNIGIGTSSPSNKLVVSNGGAAGFEFQPSTGKLFTFNRSTLAYINMTLTADVMAFNTGGENERMRIDSAGNVGIGNTATSNLLTVGKSNQINAVTLPTLRVQGMDIPFGSYGGIVFNSTNGYASTARRFLITNALTADKFAIIRSIDAVTDPAITNDGVVSSGTADFVINNSGNIGIGTDTPGVKLYVAGTDAIRIPQGTTAQRPTGAAGMFRYNTSLAQYEGHNGSAWGKVGGGATGGGSDDIFIENGQTVNTNYTITTGKNAMSAGAITIASGITVTVPSGSSWTIV